MEGFGGMVDSKVRSRVWDEHRGSVQSWKPQNRKEIVGYMRKGARTARLKGGEDVQRSIAETTEGEPVREALAGLGGGDGC